VVSLRPDNPRAAEFRQKFFAEHTHDDFEVRFFLNERGLCYPHVDARVHLVLCERGDLISVPAGTTQWFDMGSRPDFTCIRFFTMPEGWIGYFTGIDIATRLPDFDSFAATS
jgi:1,2-dihydroxy-3-keto-5-methylthiopentene dioxygenase